MSSAEEVIALAKEAGLNEKALEAGLQASKGVASALAKSCRKALELQAGAAAVVTNGRVVPLADADPLVAEDFELLTLHANAAQVADQVNVLPQNQNCPTWNEALFVPVCLAWLLCMAT